MYCLNLLRLLIDESSIRKWACVLLSRVYLLADNCSQRYATLRLARGERPPLISLTRVELFMDALTTHRALTVRMNAFGPPGSQNSIGNNWGIKVDVVSCRRNKKENTPRRVNDKALLLPAQQFPFPVSIWRVFSRRIGYFQDRKKLNLHIIYIEQHRRMFGSLKPLLATSSSPLEARERSLRLKINEAKVPRSLSNSSSRHHDSDGQRTDPSGMKMSVCLSVCIFACLYGNTQKIQQ